MKYFIASRWSNMKQVQYLTENLRALGHEVFSYGTDDRNFVPTNALEEPEAAIVDGWQRNPALKGIFTRNMEGLAGADVFVLLLPAGNTSHIEAGIAYGLSKKTVLIGQPEKAESHYLVFSSWYPSIEEYIKNLHPATTIQA
jgi:hypothetical protein